MTVPADQPRAAARKVRIVADDLTGALDSAAAFAGSVPVFLGDPGLDHNRGAPAAVAAVATATRDVPLETLPGRLSPWLNWLGGAEVPFKKIDSLLRGNTFAEIAYFVRAGGYRGAVFAPAFPALGRVTIYGRQCVVPPGKTLAERYAVGAGSPADAFTVFGLPTIGGTRRPEPEGSKPVVWIPEVITDADLAAVAAASHAPDASGWLWCGSGGLAHAIASAHGLAAGSNHSPTPETRSGTVLVFSASHHPVTRQQWEMLLAVESGAHFVTRANQLSLRTTLRALGHGLELALFDLSPSRTLSPEAAAERLGRDMTQIVRAGTRPAALVVIGGDTLLTLCRAAGAGALIAGASPRTGWGCARLSGGIWDGVPCYSRSGAFGDPDDLATMVRQLMRRAATAGD